METILSRINIADTNELAEAVESLDSESFRVAIALRVGADVCIPHSCHCDGRMDSRGFPGLSCKYRAGRFPRHSAMNDVVKRALQKAGLPSVLEPRGLDRGDDGITHQCYAEAHQFEPIAVETIGVYGASTGVILRAIGRRLVKATGEPREDNWFRQNLAIAIQRGNAFCILSARR